MVSPNQWVLLQSFSTFSEGIDWMVCKQRARARWQKLSWVGYILWVRRSASSSTFSVQRVWTERQDAQTRYTYTSKVRTKKMHYFRNNAILTVAPLIQWLQRAPHRHRFNSRTKNKQQSTDNRQTTVSSQHTTDNSQQTNSQNSRHSALTGCCKSSVG